MKYFVISDLHFGHINILRYCPNRKYSSIHDMEEDIIKRWNKQVSNEDLVFILGDITFNFNERTIDIFKRFKGRKIVIRGNHDKKPNKLLDYGIELVVDELKFSIYGYTFIMSHYPYRCNYLKYLLYKFLYLFTNKWYHKIRFFNKQPVNKGEYLLHGHIHYGHKIKDNMINVAWDLYNQPITFSEIIKLINRKSKL